MEKLGGVVMLISLERGDFGGLGHFGVKLFHILFPACLSVIICTGLLFYVFFVVSAGSTGEVSGDFGDSALQVGVEGGIGGSAVSLMAEFVAASGDVVYLPVYFESRPYVLDFLVYYSVGVDYSGWFNSSFNPENPGGFVSVDVACRVRDFINAHLGQERLWGSTRLLDIL